jgi:hypothetical protein
MKTGPVRDAQRRKKCVYNIPCEYSRCFIGETSRLLEVRIKERKHNLTQGSLEQSKLTQRASEECHRICWKEGKALQIELNTTYRKYKESAYTPLVDHPISQSRLDISPIRTPIIAAEVRKLQLCPV